MDNKRAYEIARKAVEELVRDQGTEVSFPMDAIWKYGEGSTVPGTQKSHQWRALERDGYLERTGKLTKASSVARAGSPTREYRPGSRFRGKKRADNKRVPTSIRALTVAIEARGFIISPPELVNFYLALKSSPLTILAGLSGTGKSLLPRLFAELTGATFKSIPVKPQWSDNSDLFGYSPTLSPFSFVEGTMTSALREAATDPKSLHIVLLDEMNLAPVEHYLSDFISVVETRRRDEKGGVVSDPLPLELPPIPSDAAADPYEFLRSMPIPPNVKVIGSANMDETTRPFSPKVLDRAFAIEFDDVDLTTFPLATDNHSSNLKVLAHRLVDVSDPVSEMEAYTFDPALFDHVAMLLEEIRKILVLAGISFGYRTRQAIILYLHAWKKDELADVLDIDAAFDFCIVQKVLPKVQGTAESLRQALESLAKWLDAEREDVAQGMPAGPFLRSSEKVRKMLRSLENEGFANFWSA